MSAGRAELRVSGDGPVAARGRRLVAVALIALAAAPSPAAACSMMKRPGAWNRGFLGHAETASAIGVYRVVQWSDGGGPSPDFVELQPLLPLGGAPPLEPRQRLYGPGGIGCSMSLGALAIGTVWLLALDERGGPFVDEAGELRTGSFRLRSQAATARLVEGRVDLPVGYFYRWGTINPKTGQVFVYPRLLPPPLPEIVLTWAELPAFFAARPSEPIPELPPQPPPAPLGEGQ